MFGDVTFAQAPFASQGGSTFAVAISETGSGVDAINALFTAGGLIDENISALDSVSVQSDFVAVNAETASGVDSVDTLNNIFNVDIPEAALVKNAPAIVAVPVITNVEGEAWLSITAGLTVPEAPKVTALRLPV